MEIEFNEIKISGCVNNSSLIGEAEIASWEEMKEILNKFSDQWIFRGQADATWEIKTSLSRFRSCWSDESLKYFSLAFKNVIEDYPAVRVSNLNREFEWLCLAQHYGVPTYLVDWTSCPYRASFFAFFKPLGINPQYCAIWAVNKEWCRHHALSRLKSVNDKITGQTDLASDEYFKEFFWSPTHSVNFVYPFEYPQKEAFKRAKTQKSIFLCQGNSEQSFQDNLFFDSGSGAADYEIIKKRKKMVFKLVIPTTERKKVIKDLSNTYKINHKFLFDSLDNYASFIVKGLFEINKDGERILEISKKRLSPQNEFG